MDFNIFCRTFGLWILFSAIAIAGAAWFEKRFKNAEIKRKEA